MNLASTLGRSFILAGVLPALVFVVLNRLLIWPLLPGCRIATSLSAACQTRLST